MSFPDVLQVLGTFIVPVLAIWGEKRFALIRWMSPVVMCYVVGIALGNLPGIEFNSNLALQECGLAVALAIPLLLFSTDIVGWTRLARSTVLSFGLCIGAGMAGSIAAYFLVGRNLVEGADMAGMLTGVYIGGTPNMAAIGTALDVSSVSFILLNAADMLISFAHLMFLLTIAVRLPTWFLPATRKEGGNDGRQMELWQSMPPASTVLRGGGLAVGLAAAGWLGSNFAPAGAGDAVAILVITTLAIAASMFSRVRSWVGTQDMGQFLLLVFCVSMGYTTDFVELFSASPVILVYCGVTVVIAVGLHFGLASLLRLDRDTVIITSTAAIFGPHMVGPIALALRNKQVVFSGLISGLLGYSVANYLGLLVAWLLG
jgi:uncharacterized membrane protein